MYDFVVVGAGPAGCVVASRLASTSAHPQVLLVEAGGDNAGDRIDGERYLHNLIPERNWQYKSVPQEHLGGTVIPLHRGKGLGGSSAINFSAYTIGPRDDHDEIADIVGDDEWKWANAQARYKRLETYRQPLGLEAYVNPKLEDHGQNGSLHVGFPLKWERSLKLLLETVTNYGMPVNLDQNDGDPIGVGVAASTAYNGHRTTAADFLVGGPPNLQVMTNTEAARVIFQDRRAIGVKTLDSTTVYASKEVILCCGSLDSPKILMHSGIGPEDQLEKYGIPVVQANRHVGRHMMDHHHLLLTLPRAEHTTDRHTYYQSKEAQAAARKQWECDGTGPLSEIGTAMSLAYPKLDQMYDTPEFRNLDPRTQQFLHKPTVPLWEVILNGPTIQYFTDPENTGAMTTICIVLMNTQSRGSATLQSSNPKEPLMFDENFFSHPYDRKLAVEMTREIRKLIDSPNLSEDTVGLVEPDLPASASDDEILEAWKKGTSSTWHLSGTARMGRSAETAVVDKSFKVFGVDNLRVCDCSVLPLLPNNHTQSSAYLVGLMLSDKLVEEHRLG